MTIKDNNWGEFNDILSSEGCKLGQMETAAGTERAIGIVVMNNS